MVRISSGTTAEKFGEDDPSYRLAIEASTAWYAALRATPEHKEKSIPCFDTTLKFEERDDPDLASQAETDRYRFSFIY